MSPLAQFTMYLLAQPEAITDRLEVLYSYLSDFEFNKTTYDVMVLLCLPSFTRVRSLLY